MGLVGPYWAYFLESCWIDGLEMPTGSSFSLISPLFSFGMAFSSFFFVVGCRIPLSFVVVVSFLVVKISFFLSVWASSFDFVVYFLCVCLFLIYFPSSLYLWYFFSYLIIRYIFRSFIRIIGLRANNTHSLNLVNNRKKGASALLTRLKGALPP